MKDKQFKPMLVYNEEVDLGVIKYPMLASTKLDGIRCIFMNGQMLSRSLKPIQNKQLQEKFTHVKKFSSQNDVILDGEIYGEGMTFQEITHFVMTQDLDDPKNVKKNGKEVIPEKLQFYCFDCICKNNVTQPFCERGVYLSALPLADVVAVEQRQVHNAEQVKEYFESVLDRGYEGLILKNEMCHYKFGRTTFNENAAYKVKPYMTFEAKIIDMEERFENTSESYINELGKKQKHNLKEAMKSTGLAGSLVVEYEGEKQKVALTGDESFRQGLWVNKSFYIGKWIEFKGMLVGAKDKVRHPTFIRFREDKNADA